MKISVRACLGVALAFSVVPVAAAQTDSRRPSPSIFNPPGAPSQPAPARSVGSPFEAAVPRGGHHIVRVDQAALRAAIGEGGAVTIERFPLQPGEFVELEVERFWVTSPGARFVA